MAKKRLEQKGKPAMSTIPKPSQEAIDPSGSVSANVTSISGDPEVESSKSSKSSGPSQLSVEDLRIVQLAYKEAENAALRHRLAQLEIENLAKTAEAARADLSRLNTEVNEKYGLDPAKDRINLSDGQISRGE